MAKITRFEDLECWKESRNLVKEIYKIAQKEPLSNDYGLRNQLQRASLSIMNNIAEGFARRSEKEFIRFLDISSASATEVKSMLYVLEDINYISTEESNLLHKKVDKVRNLTVGLLRYLKAKVYTDVQEDFIGYTIDDDS